MALIRKIIASFAKQKPIDAFKSFLEHDAGASVRTASLQKDRKYIHVQITEQFKKQQQSRKQLRLQQMKLRKKLLDQKLTIQSKLLTSAETQQLSGLNKDITSLEQILQNQKKDLQTIDKALEDSQANYVVVEGSKKLIVLNKIQYLKHMNYHPTGLVLHPQTITIIENVHYLVNNNLPVNKYKLYELMPELFKKQIKQLETSIQKLIQQKSLDPKTDPSSKIRFFVKHNSRFRHPEQQIIDLDEERRAMFENIQDQIGKLMEPHMNYVRMVDRGQTPFRGAIHMITVLMSDTLKLNLTEEETALRNTLLKIAEQKYKFQIYNDDVNKKIIKMRYKYIDPPEYVKNHPVLLQRYQKIMVQYTNPVNITQQLQESTGDDGRAFLEERLRKLIVQKYNPKFQELWNSGKKDQLIANKKKFQIDFYNESTRILEQYNQLIADSKQKEQFLKIPKKSRQISENLPASITIDDLTKSIRVNNTNPVKYNINFFTNFLGIQNQQQAKKLFNSFSYLRVLHQQQKSLEHLKVQVIKFKDS